MFKRYLLSIDSWISGEEKLKIIKDNPAKISIKGYIKLIFFLQFKHLPFWSDQLNAAYTAYWNLTFGLRVKVCAMGNVFDKNRNDSGLRGASRCIAGEYLAFHGHFLCWCDDLSISDWLVDWLNGPAPLDHKPGCDWCIWYAYCGLHCTEFHFIIYIYPHIR